MAIGLKFLHDINNNNINPKYSVHVNTVVIATAFAVMCNMNNNGTK